MTGTKPRHCAGFCVMKRTKETKETKETKKTEFSKKWLIGCMIVSVMFTAASYILAFLDKNPVAELSEAIIETLWGTSGISFVGYALQNSVRAYTASKFGLPVKGKNKDAE